MVIVKLLISDVIDLLKTGIYVLIFDKVNQILLNQATGICSFRNCIKLRVVKHTFIPSPGEAGAGGHKQVPEQLGLHREIPS